MSKPKKDHPPGMSDAENVFEEIETQEKAERKKLWLEEHRSGKIKPKGGEKYGVSERGKTGEREQESPEDSQDSNDSSRGDKEDAS